MKTLKKLSTLLFFLSTSANALTPNDNFRNGIIGTGFVSNGGSTTYEYKVLIDYRIHGRHQIELKFVERNNYSEPPLDTIEETETIMVNCKEHTYTTSLWLKENNNTYGQSQYKNGGSVNWKDNSDNAYANYGNGWILPLYLKMVCNSV
ncbi:hypothetical protein JD974_21525 [Chromobacterium haemolyticum]|uniref:PLAT domain-containing protein n=1 Tax=Chromobacterium haemolyticum TaxID=394935 RepID=A0ABS3GST8_9NEIS|nr:hypothetical protein [Chromobacterium haemolyticum]MBK0416989.1 hypothetical protein [Chromobacterium haemolyticum]MBO0418116.1 hypothetical protein [Chromobacterium haemolyticum]MBO0501388.1 hypothetical protein [Chromobacterium haemolyticum]